MDENPATHKQANDAANPKLASSDEEDSVDMPEATSVDGTTTEPTTEPDNTDVLDNNLSSETDMATPSEVPEVTSTTDPAKKRFPVKKVIVILVVLLNLGVGATSAYLLTHPTHAHDAPPSSTKELKTVTAVPAKEPDAAPQPTSIHYKSEALKLEFDYPVDWHISSQNGDKFIRINSADFDVKAADGAKIKGKLWLEIAAKDTGDYWAQLTDDSLIAFASEKQAYANPGPNQRKETYYTFVAGTGHPAQTFDYTFISGNLIYTAGQHLKDKNYKTIDPHISMYVEACPTERCHYLATAPLTMDNWHNEPTLQKAQKLIQSLRIN